MSKISIKNSDKIIIRELAKQYADIANSQAMEESRLAWKKLNDGTPFRAVYSFETDLINDFIAIDELKCEDIDVREIEKKLRRLILHKTLIDDDYLLQKFWNVDYVIDTENKDYGVGLTYTHNSSNAIVSNHPITSADKLAFLKKRKFSVNRQLSQERYEWAQELFSNTLDVRLRNNGMYIPQLTRYLYDLIGSENMMLWMYDEEEALKNLCAYLVDDITTFYKMCEESCVVELNNRDEVIGAGAYGHTSRFDNEKNGLLKNNWLWLESQETSTISPQSFFEFYLPSLKQIGKEFGAIYYGCCEPLNDRIEKIIEQIPNIVTVSCSPYSNSIDLAEKLDGKRILSYKPTPSKFLFNADLAGLKKDVLQVKKAVKNNMLQVIFRDVYSVCNDRNKFREWGKMMNSVIR